VAGAGFLAAFLCYGLGHALVDRSLGPVLMLLNSVVVVIIGAAVFRVLHTRHPKAAATYFIARSLEAALLAVGLFLLIFSESAVGNNVAYQIAMIILGVGSQPFCRVLLRDRLVPTWLAFWGIGGYLVLGAGALLELVGANVGLALAVPGGLFEVALGVILIIRGFPEPITMPAAIRRRPVNTALGAE
jgi:hypothetical protein